ncbi:hypothetical protein [Cobetia amphilecti]|uniref:hypothetical protein n=1 Tax=Cobetia amphilecti TaxID=1055104 RepID=UPI00244BF761|nr:hypothetical protein [Cobetia litoralis]MDH2421724.1 hypothetical protein [Cobetia litoralis]
MLVIAAWNIWRLQDGIGAKFHLSAAVMMLLLLSLACNLLHTVKYEGWHYEDYAFQKGGFVALDVVLLLLITIMIGIVTVTAWLYAPRSSLNRSLMFRIIRGSCYLPACWRAMQRCDFRHTG